jgi:monoamine oxidase
MDRWSRRSFLTVSAAVAASSSLAAPKRQAPSRERQSSDVDFDAVVVGAGAAGIAAARRLATSRKKFVVLEAASRVGGRCVTDTTRFGVPYDLGAHWIYLPDTNPIAKLATQTGLDIYPAPPGQRVRIGRRYARESELEEYLSGLVRTTTAISEATRGRTDVACAQVLPKDLGDWRNTIEFFLGPFSSGKDLTEVSAFDFAKSTERDLAAFCRQGFGTLLAKLASNLPVRLSTPVTRIDHGRRVGCAVETAKGLIEANAVIVTASTNVLASSGIKFTPGMPKRQIDALARLRLGSYDHVALELPNNPFDLRADELMFEKSSSERTAALFANVSGSTLCTVEVAGRFGRDLADKGEEEMVAFALDWLGGLYGADIKNSAKRRHATRWNEEPYALGAFSGAAPGGQPARKMLAEPVDDRVWLAGEAIHESLWGTVGGAWESGERAADAILRRLR